MKVIYNFAKIISCYIILRDIKLIYRESSESSLVVDIELSAITATFFAYPAKILKQPLILGFFVAGILNGTFARNESS